MFYFEEVLQRSSLLLNQVHKCLYITKNSPEYIALAKFGAGEGKQANIIINWKLLELSSNTHMVNVLSQPELLLLQFLSSFLFF